MWLPVTHARQRLEKEKNNSAALAQALEESNKLVSASAQPYGYLVDTVRQVRGHAALCCAVVSVLSVTM